MISLNSLAAFTAEVTRNAGLQPWRGAAPAVPAPASAAPQRVLHEVPPHPPAHPLPRGSLLDLRI